MERCRNVPKIVTAYENLQFQVRMHPICTPLHSPYATHLHKTPVSAPLCIPFVHPCIRAPMDSGLIEGGRMIGGRGMESSSV